MYVVYFLLMSVVSRRNAVSGKGPYLFPWAREFAFFKDDTLAFQRAFKHIPETAASYFLTFGDA